MRMAEAWLEAHDALVADKLKLELDELRLKYEAKVDEVEQLIKKLGEFGQFHWLPPLPEDLCPFLGVNYST